MDTCKDLGLESFDALVYETRTVRRFDESKRVGRDFLLELVDLARMSPNSKNFQVLRYRVVSEPEECEAVFQNLAWAAALPQWKGPEAGERPTGYVVIVAELPESGHLYDGVLYDAGIAAQTMMLAARAAEPSVGCCMLRAVKPAIMETLGIDRARYEFKMVCAFGYPAEEVVVEPLSASPDGSINYWHDEEGRHHVPKRALEDVLL